MKPNPIHLKSLPALLLGTASLLLATTVSYAATITKADTGTELTDPASWLLGVTPNSTDVATWSGTSLGAGLTLGANTNWLGLSVSGAASDINITGIGVLTLGTGGLDASNSPVNLTLGNPVALGGAQTWGVNSGVAVSVSGIVSGAGALTKTLPGSLTLSGVNTYSGATTIRAGTVTLSGNRTVASGAITVGGDTNVATLNLQAGVYAFGSSGLAVGTGTTAGTNGILNQTGGAVSFASGTAVLVGNGGTTAGIYNLSGGSISGFNSANRGVLLGVNDSCAGIFNLSGNGNLNLGNGAVQLGRSEGTSTPNNTRGYFYQTGGTASIGTLVMGSKAVGSGASAVLSLTGGTFTNSSFPRLCLGANDTAAITIGGTADVTMPAFPVTRGGGATATITFDGGTFRPYAASAAFMSGMTAAYLTANGANFNVASGRDITVAQVFEDAPSQAGVLTKAGAGVLTLSGANSYSGATIIIGGSLRVNGSLAATSAVTVQTGATLSGSGLAGGTITVQNGGVISAGDGTGVGNLTLGSLVLGAAPGDTQTLNVTLNTATVSVLGPLSNHGTNIINVSSSGVIPPGVYPLIVYTGPTITSGFGLGSAPGGATLQYGASSIDLVVTDSLRWTGLNSATWDMTTTNWQWITANVPANYANGVPLLFDDSLTANPDITLNTIVSPGGATFANEFTTYSLTGLGGMAGSRGLTKNGAGVLILGTANTYSGDSTLLGTGMLALTNSSALGASTLNLKSARTDNLPTVLLSGGITVTNPVIMDSTTGREGFYSTNGNNTLTGPISLVGSTVSHLLFQNDGPGGSVFAVSNSIIGPLFAGHISLRGNSNALGVIAGQVDINSQFQINGSANWTVTSTSNRWTQTLIQGENGSLIIGASDALATNARVTFNSTTAGALDLAGFSQTVGGLECTATPTYPSLGVGNSSTTSDSLLRIAGGTYTFAGRLVDTFGGGTRKLSLEVLGGNQTLTGENTYSGPTVISGGTLNIGAGGVTGSLSNTASIVNNGTLVFNRSDAFVVTHEITGSGNLTLAGNVVARPASASALGGGTITVGTLQPDASRVELQGGLALTNNLAFRTRNYPAGFPAHYLNVSGTNMLNPPTDLVLGTGGNVISLESGGGHLILTKGVTTTASAPRYLALFGAGDGEVQGSLSANMALSKGGTGTWALTGSSPMGGPVVVSNGTLVVHGSLTTPTILVTIAGGTLAGNGSIAGSVTVDPDGRFAPGVSAGTLTINNALTLQGTTVMEIGRNGAAITADQVSGLNSVTYGGTLVLTNIGTSPLQVGDVFKLFAATNYAGEFANLTYPDGYTFTNKLGVDGTIEVLTSPFASPPTLSYAVSGGNWVFSWPGSGFKLQTQTNTLAVGLGTNWADVPGGGTSGVAVQAPVAGNPAVFFRLISTP